MFAFWERRRWGCEISSEEVEEKWKKWKEVR